VKNQSKGGEIRASVPREISQKGGKIRASVPPRKNRDESPEDRNLTQA